MGEVKVQELPMYLTTKEAAEIIGVTPEWLRRLRCMKKGPAWCKSRSGAVRYLPEAVKEYMECTRVEPEC